ncbi:hypothetical protein Tco_1405198 [Tanacetum coccineum]
MSTSKTYQQSLAEAGSKTRPPMLERGSYIQWASRFKRFLNRKRENRKWLLKVLEDGPYVFRTITPTEMELTNMILLSIPNEIYNYVDSCKTTKEMWDRVERLMRGTIKNQVDRETQFTNEFDQFVAEPGESLVSIYNLRLAKKLTVDSFDDLFDYLLQFEKLVNASRSKKLEKSHDPLALLIMMKSLERMNFHSHSEDPLAFAMLLLAKAITQNFSNPTNNHLRASSNTRNQAVVQGDRVNIQSRNSDEAGEIFRYKNDFLFADASRMEENEVTYYDEAAKQQRFAQKVQQQNENLISQIEMYKERNRVGYPNPYTLKQAISECPKLYVASRTGNIEIPLNVRDSKETLEEAFKSQQKMNAKMNNPIAVANKQNCWTIDYKQLNALYNDFVPKKESFVAQTCPSSPYTPFVKILETKTMPFDQWEEIALNAFCRDQVKPLLNELLDHFDGFQNLFQRDIKEMKDAFEQNDVYLDEIERQNDLLKDQLLEVSLKHDIDKRIQEGLKARIKILEKAVQRCEKQSVDFELKLQHEKEKQKWDSSKNKNSKPLDFSWISRIQKLEDENVSLEFKVKSLIKERDNAKMEYKKLFDSIKKTRSQNQRMNATSSVKTPKSRDSHVKTSVLDVSKN